MSSRPVKNAMASDGKLTVDLKKWREQAFVREKPSLKTKPAKPTEVEALTSALKKTKLQGDCIFKFVSTKDDIVELVEKLVKQPTSPPSLFVHLEGVNLSRHGSISILQIYIGPTDEAYLVDVHTLKEDAFSHTTPDGKCLRDVLESTSIPKVFFDVRNDSDALYSHFGVKLAGIKDLQLMEIATRTFSKNYVNGLAKCIGRDIYMSPAERVKWEACKEKGHRLFAPERGGSYEVFNVRPLAEDMLQYCIQDVRLLPRLY